MIAPRWLGAVGAVALLGAAQAPFAHRPAAADGELRLRDTTLTWQWVGTVAMVDAEPLARHLAATWRAAPGGRYDLTRGGVRAEFHEGLPFVRIQGQVHPLTAAPQRRSRAVLIPLQVVTEWLPRHDSTLVYDRSRNELRIVAPRADRPVATSRRVIIDPGHGGKEPGMQGRLPDGRIVWEKDITLGVSLELAELLKARGVGVHLTRTRDTLINLDDRGRIANAQRGDLFVSVHVNAANPAWANATGARGFETYFLAEAKTEDERRVAQMENEVVRFETSADPVARDPLGFIINDMAQNEHLRESLELAAAIQSGIARRHPGPNRGVKQAGFRVLVRAFMPAVLIELGFGSNPTEAAWMVSPAGKRALAEAIAESVVSYLDQYQRRVSGGGS